MNLGKIWMWIVTAVGMAGLMVGCTAVTDDGGVMSHVPSDAVVVKVVDLQQMLKAAGCSNPFDTRGNLKDDAEKVVSLVASPDYREGIAEFLKVKDAVDIANVVAFTDAVGNEMVLVPLHGNEKMLSALDNLAGGVTDVDGVYRYATVGGCVMAVGERYCWLAPDMEAVRLADSSASGRHFATMVGVDEFLSSDCAMNVAVNCGRSMLSFLGGADRWLGVSLRITDVSVSVVGRLIDRDGRQYPLGKDFKEIDTDFLRYTPGDAAVVLAFGRFSGNPRALGFLLGRFAPVYLDYADGTTSLYAVPAGGAEAVAAHAPGSWNVETMIHVPEDVLAAGLESYRADAPGGAVEVGNQWTYSDGGCNYYFGAFDGCLVYSTNREISADYNNEFTDDFAGKRAAMVVTVPAESVLASAWNLPYGLTLKIAVDELQWKARITFHGSDMNAFESLLQLPSLPDYCRRFHDVSGF